MTKSLPPALKSSYGTWSGEHCKLPSGVQGGAPVESEFGAFSLKI